MSSAIIYSKSWITFISVILEHITTDTDRFFNRVMASSLFVDNNCKKALGKHRNCTSALTPNKKGMLLMNEKYGLTLCLQR